MKSRNDQRDGSRHAGPCHQIVELILYSPASRGGDVRVFYKALQRDFAFSQGMIVAHSTDKMISEQALNLDLGSEMINRSDIEVHNSFAQWGNIFIAFRHESQRDARSLGPHRHEEARGEAFQTGVVCTNREGPFQIGQYEFPLRP